MPVDLPVGFGIDQAGAGLIGHLHREAAQTVAVADEAVLAVLHESAGVELAHLLFHVLRADGLAHAAVDRAVRPVVHVDAHIELAVVEILLALAVAGHKMDAAVMPVDDLIELLERQIRLVVDIDALTGDLGLHLRQIDRLINLCLPVVERLDKLSRQTAELIVLKLRIVGIAAVEVADLPGRLVRIRDLVEYVAGVHAVDEHVGRRDSQFFSMSLRSSFSVMGSLPIRRMTCPSSCTIRSFVVLGHSKARALSCDSRRSACWSVKTYCYLLFLLLA